MTDDDIRAAMTALPECTLTMLVCADAIEERGGIRDGLRAEGLRLLAECGKVGYYGLNYTYWSIEKQPADRRVPEVWWIRADSIGPGLWMTPVVDSRLALIDAYADATDAERDRWQSETRALTPVTAVS